MQPTCIWSRKVTWQTYGWQSQYRHAKQFQFISNAHGCESLLRYDATMAWLSLLRPSAHPSFVPWINQHQILSLSYSPLWATLVYRTPHLTYVTAIPAWRRPNRMESPTTRTHHLTLLFHSTFTNALLGCPRRHWDSLTSFAPWITYLFLVPVQPRLTCLALLWLWNSYPPHPPRPPTTLLIAIPTPFSTLIPAYTPHSPWCAVHHCSSPPRSSRPPTVFFYGWYGSLDGQSAADEGDGVIGMGRDIDIMGMGWRRRKGMRDRGRRVFCAGWSAAELDTWFRRLDSLFLFVLDSSLPTR